MCFGFTPTVWGRLTANTQSWLRTCFIHSVCGIQCPHFTCPIMPRSPVGISLTHTHTHTHRETHTERHTHSHTDCPQDNTARPIPSTWQGLPLFDSFICLFGYQQPPRTQTLCLLDKMARSRKFQPSEFYFAASIHVFEKLFVPTILAEAFVRIVLCISSFGFCECYYYLFFSLTHYSSYL